MAEERRCSQCGGELPDDAPQGLCPQCLMKQGLQADSEAATAAASDDQGDVATSAAAPAGFVPPEPSELATQFPQLEILELLGQGGMGAVYKARQKHLDRIVALKILPPEVGQDSAFAERFAREVRSLARLNHPHIVTVHDFGHTEQGLYYFIMEFVDGTDLRHVIQAGELSPEEALAIVPQICEALQFAHEEGIVHRDIKPENILLDKKGRVKIADFGLAKLLDRPTAIYTLTRAGQRMGTPHYMAPEQFERPEQVDHRADIYSLGVVFYEMLTGELPIGRFAPPSQKVQVDVRLDEVVLRTLEKEPERRYQQASEVKTDVETICSDKRPEQAEGKGSAGPKYEGIGTIRQRVWIPAVGLLVAGAINCLAVLGALVGMAISLIQKGFSGQLITFGLLPASVELIIVAAVAAHGLCVLLGAWNLMQLRSYRWALAGGILGMCPFFPGAFVGLPMGIWALILITKKEVKAAFGQEKTEVAIPPKVREFAVSAVDTVKVAFDRGKAEIGKIVEESSTRSQDSDTAEHSKGLRMAIASFVLGLLSVLIVSLEAGFAIKFAYGFVSIFLAVSLGIMAIRNIKNYREHLVHTGLAIAGIFFASISIIKLLVTGTS